MVIQIYFFINPSLNILSNIFIYYGKGITFGMISNLHNEMLGQGLKDLGITDIWQIARLKEFVQAYKSKKINY